jgi:hypothetical protein
MSVCETRRQKAETIFLAARRAWLHQLDTAMLALRRTTKTVRGHPTAGVQVAARHVKPFSPHFETITAQPTLIDQVCLRVTSHSVSTSPRVSQISLLQTSHLGIIAPTTGEVEVGTAEEAQDEAAVAGGGSHHHTRQNALCLQAQR